MLHLILHKVRGKAALDIALRCDEMGTPTDPGPWWMMPTTGHRCHPVHSIPLEQLNVLELLGFDVSDAPDLYDVRIPRTEARLGSEPPPPRSRRESPRRDITADDLDV